MTVATSRVANSFVNAIVARDFARARGLLHPEIDFRAMTPKRVWEADEPEGVEDTLRAWFEHPDREVTGIDATEFVEVADTLRVGWRVRGNNANGRFNFEQQAYVREREGQIGWLRVMCTGPRPV